MAVDRQDETIVRLNDRSAYGAEPLARLLTQPETLNWQIDCWLQQGSLALLVGPEASFKSFLAIDWAMSVATGTTWQGRRVEQGRVLYIPGEGRSGVIRRMRGWLKAMDLDAAGRVEMLVGNEPIVLLDPVDADRIAALGRFNLVVIDTLARCYGPGSENSAEDMSAAIRTADAIRTKTGATALIVHHAPLEGREDGKLRPRGSSALAGAADAIFTCQYDKSSRVITLAHTKAKDSMLADTQFMSFDVVDLGNRDNFGNRITTVVMKSTQNRPASKKGLGKNQRQLVRKLRELSNGDAELLVCIRDVTNDVTRNRQSRSKLEAWFRQEPWSRQAKGGHIVDMEALPNV